MLVFSETTKFLELFFFQLVVHEYVNQPIATPTKFCFVLSLRQKTYFFGNISLVVVGEKGYVMIWEGRSVCSKYRVLWYLTHRVSEVNECVKYHNTRDLDGFQMDTLVMIYQKVLSNYVDSFYNKIVLHNIKHSVSYNYLEPSKQAMQYLHVSRQSMAQQKTCAYCLTCSDFSGSWKHTTPCGVFRV